MTVSLWRNPADPQLVTVNNPDKIIFVGEALVGNEAVDQLTKFDRALKDFSGAGTGGGQRKRGIDGIILTKFDTIVSLFWPASRLKLTDRTTRWARRCR